MAAGFLTPLVVDLQMHLPSPLEHQGFLQFDERGGEDEQRPGELAMRVGEGEQDSPEGRGWSATGEGCIQRGISPSPIATSGAASCQDWRQSGRDWLEAFRRVGM
jgi:hypothetical protein